MFSVADLTSKIIFKSIKADATYVIAADKKQRDFQFELQKFSNKLQVLSRKAESTLSEIDALNNWYVTAAPKKKVKKTKVKNLKTIKKKDKKTSVARSIEEKLHILDKAESELREGKEIYAQVKSKFGKNKAASRVIKESENLIAYLQRNIDKANKVINKISADQRPATLTEKNKKVQYLIKYVKDCVKNYDGEAKKKPKLGKSYYSADRSEKGGLRFSRYLEILDAPKQDGTSFKSIYIVLSVDFQNPKFRSGKIITNEANMLYVTIIPQDVRPSKLTQSFALLKNLDVENNLAVLAYRNGLDLLQRKIKTDVYSMRDKLKERGVLKILGDAQVKMKLNKSKFSVFLPDSVIIWITEGKKLRGDFEEDLYVDVKRILRQPMSKNKASRHTTDRLKLEKWERKRLKKSRGYVFTFNLLPVGVSQLQSDKDMPKSELSADEFKKILRREMYKDMNHNR